MFNWTEIKNRGKGLTFDDVLIIPARSDVRSRRDPQLTSKLTRNVSIETPIVSANMDMVTEYDMAFAMNQLGGLGILHRFLSIEDQAAQARRLKENGVKNISASVGVGEEFKSRSKALVDAGVNIITIDIAHGHSVQMMETMKWLKDHYPQVELIAGNMATPDAARDLIESGADAIKVGIGPGSMCTTRIITGCGVPQLTAIALCAEVAASYGVPVIADGGIRNSGDMVKAFAAGASTVMLGSMLSGTIETPGEIKNGKKHYRGMASRSAQDSWRGGVPEGMAPEGESTQVNVKGHVKDVIFEVTGGIRSGMSYINATSIAEIKEKALFMEMSANGISESRAHGVKS
ncbi:guanosine monophosphate reductase [Bdellovibrio svalbardensis]|uniref:IMP dehydrogenase n=1 Tax=Bdellovibrio svalbardensis TaxID=2972972 RepID=A0ABT6DNR3_9BACT|nr:IMP dehydrogenase [Bdellovibrio svalbardensis]MDG0818274.1 IMP dehydrogenase [Bdellovibrio svalbardensis]